MHPTETHLPAIPGVRPAVPLAKVAVRDIARRLSHRTAATPRAQKTWLEKLGYGTNGLQLDWDKLYAHTFNKILIPRDRDVFYKLLHRATGPLHTGGFGINKRPCPKCHNANYNLIHLARCTGNEPIFNMVERVIAAIEPGASFSNPNPPAAHAVSAAHRLNLLAQRILACQLDDPTSLASPAPSRATPLSRASVALYALTWDRVYKTAAAMAIEADGRRANRLASAPLSPAPAPPLLAAASAETVKLILTTFQTRILGLAKSRAQTVNIANSLGAKQDARKVINKELKGAAAIADDGVLRLDTNVAAAINAIYSELNFPSLRALQPTRVLPPKPAEPAAPANAHASPGHAPAHPRRAGLGFGMADPPDVPSKSATAPAEYSDAEEEDDETYMHSTPFDYSDDDEEEPRPQRRGSVSLLSDDLSSDSDDYEEDETASSAAAASNAAPPSPSSSAMLIPPPLHSSPNPSALPSLSLPPMALLFLPLSSALGASDLRRPFAAAPSFPSRALLKRFTRCRSSSGFSPCSRRRRIFGAPTFRARAREMTERVEGMLLV